MRNMTMDRRMLSRAAGLAVAAAAAGGPVATLAQGATPAAQPASGGLAEMLALAPASYPWVEEPENLTINVADIAAQLAVAGVTPPDTMDDPDARQWVTATFGMAMPIDALEYLRLWREDYGFDLLQADQTLWVSSPPFNLALYRGRFDHDAVRARLTEHGYAEIEFGGHTLLSLRDDYEIDFDGPFAYKLAAMNHAAFLEDGTIAFSSVRAALAAVLDVAAGNAPSLMDQSEIAMLAEHAPAGVVSGTIVPGTAVAGSLPPAVIEVIEAGGTPDLEAVAAEIAATGEMPPIALLMLYATAGGPFVDPSGTLEGPTPWDGVPDGRAGALALMLNPEAAEAAVPVVEERLATGETGDAGVPYTDYFPEWDVRAAPSQPVLIVDLVLAPERRRDHLWRMLFDRELGFLSW